MSITDIKFTNVTHKELYKSNIYKIPGFHHSQIKWVETLNTPVVWEEVWKTVHHFLSTNEDISFIWEQIHLNFYTQYSYNKWHRKQQTFPLCGEIPKNIYHIILYCDVVVKLWRDLDSLLLKLCSVPISDSEKAFGIVTEKPTSGILIRNWLTYKMRKAIEQVEREACFADFNVISKIKQKIQSSVGKELDQKLFFLWHE